MIKYSELCSSFVLFPQIEVSVEGYIKFRSMLNFRNVEVIRDFEGCQIRRTIDVYFDVCNDKNVYQDFVPDEICEHTKLVFRPPIQV